MLIAVNPGLSHGLCQGLDQLGIKGWRKCFQGWMFRLVHELGHGGNLLHELGIGKQSTQPFFQFAHSCCSSWVSKFLDSGEDRAAASNFFASS